MTRTQTIAVATLAALGLSATVALACQQIPSIPCRLDPVGPIINKNDPFSLELTITNFPVTPPFPPPFLDDLDFDVTVNSDGPMSRCQLPGMAGHVSLDPSSYTVQLDEAWSPFADEPTTDTRTIAATPTLVGDYYAVSAFVCAGSTPSGCDRGCFVTACIEAYDDPQALPTPYAEFVEPTQTGDAGSELPFQLRVRRNGYTPGVPLTVKVTPANPSDLLDLFPIEPATLTSTGYDVLGDDEIVEFQCSTHFPCFAGISNVYHVTISDGATVVWDSQLRHWEGIGAAIVDRVPLAHMELVEIQDQGGDGALETGEEGTIHLRLYGRCPYVDAPLDGARLELDLPAGLSYVSADLHHHDNPYDRYEPTPAELAATGTVTDGGTVIIIDTPAIESRFTTLPATPPAVFRDLFEVELVLALPPGGYPTARDLDFTGLRVTGTAATVPKAETSAGLTIPVTLAAPPNEVDELLLVKSGSDDVRLLWADPPTDPSHAAAESFELYRSETDPVTGYASFATVLDTLAPVEEGFDPGALTRPEPLAYYKISAFNAHGDSGDVP